MLYSSFSHTHHPLYHILYTNYQDMGPTNQHFFLLPSPSVLSLPIQLLWEVCPNGLDRHRWWRRSTQARGSGGGRGLQGVLAEVGAAWAGGGGGARRRAALEVGAGARQRRRSARGGGGGPNSSSPRGLIGGGGGCNVAQIQRRQALAADPLFSRPNRAQTVADRARRRWLIMGTSSNGMWQGRSGR